MRVYLGSDHAGHELKKYRVRHFLNSPFSDEPRHRQRIAMLVRYENSGQRPPMPGR
jgi:ribose 5-phosphate isomerase RpiB